MIIFNDVNAIEVPSNIDVKDLYKIYSIDVQQLPFVQLRRCINNSIKCVTGYIYADGNVEEEQIQIKHIFVDSINIVEEVHKECQDPFMMGTDKYYINFNYEIEFHIEHNYQNTYVFNSSDILWYKNGSIISKDNKSIISFFTNVIPLINESLDMGYSITELNMEYFRQKYLDGDKVYESYESNPFNIVLDDVLDLIYNVETRIETKIGFYDKDHTCYVTFEEKNGIIYNLYIANLFSAIINARLYNIRKDGISVYSGNIYGLPLYLNYDAESLRRYIQRKLYVGVIFNYNQDMAIEGFHHCSKLNKIKDISQNTSIRLILNFILGIKVTCIEDGDSRVGRDDIGWVEYTVLFPIENGFKPSSFMLELINTILNIKLILQEDNLCYYHQHVTDREPIVSAHRRDLGSERLQKEYLHKLLKKIVPLLDDISNVDKLVMPN